MASIRLFILSILLVVTHYNYSFAQVSHDKAFVLFLYSFTKYVQWPEGDIKDKFVIGVYGKSSITEGLNELASSRKAGEATIEIVNVENENQLTNIHLLFVPENKSDKLTSILNQIKGKATLVVCEKDGMVAKGAGISFRQIGEATLRFELNKEAVTAQNLKISKSLESLAHKGS